ncbi:MAG: aromatic amino acid lyase [Saprospiraceae bacterium]|nr:aromatic amino acid lyase [Candidatus Opimibacter skivensis]
MDHYVFDGAELTVEDIIGITSAKLTLSEKVWQRIADNRAALENLIEQSGERYYGINTGFGSLYSVTVSPDGLQQLQTNLLRSHACGVGPAVPQAIVRLTLLMKIISLAQGQSGVRKEVIRFLLDLYNLHITPVVPMLGSLGASGDLAPLAHLCLPMIGEGEVVYKREQMPAAKALMLAGLDAIDLEAKEGLALINGTQYSLAWLVYSINSALRLSEVCEMTAAMSIDAFDAHPSFLDAGIHAVRKQVGQMQSAEAISKWLDGSEVIKKTKEHLQDPYSFRCAPQVHGASRDVITYAKTIADREINAVTDNPLVLGDGDDVRIVSGGNFHAQPLALTSDFLALAIAEYGSISERRSYLLLGGKRGLPPTLAQNPGLESGMMICQYTAAAIVNRNKILSSGIHGLHYLQRGTRRPRQHGGECRYQAL